MSLYVAYATANQVAIFDLLDNKITKTITLSTSPTGMALSADGSRLYVTCADLANEIAVVDTGSAEIIRELPGRPGVCAPVISRSGKILYVCQRYVNHVAAIDLAMSKELSRIAVMREPVAASLTPDGKMLLVVNHLPAGPANGERVGAALSVVDTVANRLLTNILFPNGSTGLRSIAISPDGRFACVPHTLARFKVPTTQVQHGWMNSSALSLIDLFGLKLVNTVLLDDMERGAANPWSAAWTADGRYIGVTHAPGA
jgi:DNA-binding beta-propeller fold protein YncE